MDEQHIEENRNRKNETKNRKPEYFDLGLNHMQAPQIKEYA